jgi:phosphoribosylamine---glycine ligase
MNTTRILFVSIEGLSCDLAWRVSREGYDVKFHIQNEADQLIGDGFVEKSYDLEKDIEWADIVVFDDVLGYGAMAEDLRKTGKQVIGGTRYTDRLEDDRSFGQEELRRHGVGIIPFADFTSFDDAIDYVTKNPARYVIKPSGEAQNIKRLLFVGEEEDGKDIIHVLESYKRAY